MKASAAERIQEFMTAGLRPPTGEAERATRARGPALMHRLMMIHELLVNGAAPEEALAQAQLKWHVSRRTALRYLYRVRKRLTETGYREDGDYVHQMGLAQRGRILGKVLSCLREVDPTEPGSVPLVSQLAGVAAKLIDARDRSALELEAAKAEPAVPPRMVTRTSRTTQAIVMTTHDQAEQSLLGDLGEATTAAGEPVSLAPQPEPAAPALEVDRAVAETARHRVVNDA